MAEDLGLMQLVYGIAHAVNSSLDLETTLQSVSECDPAVARRAGGGHPAAQRGRGRAAGGRERRRQRGIPQERPHGDRAGQRARAGARGAERPRREPGCGGCGRAGPGGPPAERRAAAHGAARGLPGHPAGSAGTGVRLAGRLLHGGLRVFRYRNHRAARRRGPGRPCDRKRPAAFGAVQDRSGPDVDAGTAALAQAGARVSR